MDTITQSLLDTYQPLLESTFVKATEQLNKEGFEQDLLPTLGDFAFSYTEDSFTQQAVLQGRWSPATSQRRGSLVVNSDGSIMFELDLLCPHPQKDERWAEQVSVWGKQLDRLRSEISILSTLS